MARAVRTRSLRAASAQIVRIKLRLYPGEDDDLIGFFSGIPAGLRATSVKLALRSGVENSASIAQDESEEMLDALDAFVL